MILLKLIFSDNSTVLQWLLTDQVMQFVREFVQMLDDLVHPLDALPAEDTLVPGVSPNFQGVYLHDVF